MARKETWQVKRIINEEGVTLLGPFKTKHMAMFMAEKDAARMKWLGYDPVWYFVEEVKTDGVEPC